MMELMKIRNLLQQIAHLRLLVVTVAILSCGSQLAHAQTKLPQVGFLTISSPNKLPVVANWLEISRRVFAQQGFVEGKNFTIIIRDAQGISSNFDQAAAALVNEHVDIIFAIGAPALRAAHNLTKSIPIVGTDYTNDPIAVGYVKSYGHPGGNVTGVFLDAPEFTSKWLEMMREIIPNLKRVAAIWDPSPGKTHINALSEICKSFGIQLQVIEIHKAEDIDNADVALGNRPQAVVILPSPMFYAENSRLVKLATRIRLPFSSIFPRFAVDGGLFGYGPNDTWTTERQAMLAAKILHGAKPGDLPIERPVKFDLIVNLKTAKALNIKMPETVLARAERIIR